MHPDQFPDGLYLTQSGGSAYLVRTVFVLSRGYYFGLGPLGGEYEGTYVFDPSRKLTKFAGHVTIPPNTPLVTGGTSGPSSLRTAIASEAKYAAGAATRFSFSFGGKSVDVALRFVRPLPV
jgi:hypothetical protein